MPALLRRLSLVGLLAAALSATAESGYLPKVGPPPVRFQHPPAPPAEPAVTLPPLVFIEPRPATPAPVSTAPATPATTPAPAVDPEPSNPLRDPVQPEPPANPAPPVLMMDLGAPNVVPVDQGVLAPQMFMRYFTGQPGTNGSGVSIFAPVGFVPPLPLALPPPSSSATFQTVPPGKP